MAETAGSVIGAKLGGKIGQMLGGPIGDVIGSVVGALIGKAIGPTVVDNSITILKEVNKGLEIQEEFRAKHGLPTMTSLSMKVL